MAWFSKPKRAKPAAPGVCTQCGERPGTALVTIEAGPGGHAARTVWLCDLCREDVGREAGNN